MRCAKRSVLLSSILGVLVALGAVTLLSCNTTSEADQDAAPEADASTEPWEGPITPAELDEALADKDFLLINIHVPYSGEIPGTDTHIPYNQIDDLVDYIGPDLGTRVVLYCLTDHMTDIAEPELVARGYTAIRSLEGGMFAWQMAGYPVEQ